MTPHFARSFTASFGLHVTVAGAALLLAAIAPRVTLEPKPLEIITLLPSSYGPTRPFVDATPGVVVPIPQPAPVVAPESRPVPAASESRPAPVSQPTPRPQPTRPAPPRTTRTASPPAPVAPPSNQRMTHQEFVAQHGQPGPATPTNKPRPAAPTPQISAATIMADLLPGPQATQVTDTSFTAAFLAKLQAAFAATGPWPEDLAATISFMIGADGKLRMVEVATSSKHPAFDAAAQSACRQTRAEGVPQSATGQPYQITFRSVPRR